MISAPLRQRHIVIEPQIESYHPVYNISHPLQAPNYKIHIDIFFT